MSSLQQELEAALVESPDDLAAHVAYADHLIERGDPRGEFIRVQLALEDETRPADERRRSQEREQEFFATHGRGWLGGLARHPSDPSLRGEQHDDGLKEGQFRFRRGWLDRLTFPALRVAEARALAREPQARLLSHLTVEYVVYYALELGERYEPGDDVAGAPPHSPGLDALRGSPSLRNIRIFQLGERVSDEYESGGTYYNCHTDGRAAVALLREMPRLEELYLLAHYVDTDQLFALGTLRHLRVLQAYHLHHYPLAILAANPALESLTHLLLHPGGSPSPEDPHIRLADLQAIARSRHLQSLTHLQLRVSDLGDEGCEEIVQSGLLRRLKVLDLQHGTITDAGARTLAACPDLPRLELLNLRRNQLTQAGAAALQAAGCRAFTDDRYDEEEIELRWFVGEGDVE
jgi:uncharacterized protein (TIGR02996 family)